MFRTSVSKSTKIQKNDSIWIFPIDFYMFTNVMPMIRNTKMNILSIEHPTIHMLWCGFSHLVHEWVEADSMDHWKKCT